jgi:hypothetical protein
MVIAGYLASLLIGLSLGLIEGFGWCVLVMGIYIIIKELFIK